MRPSTLADGTRHRTFEFDNFSFGNYWTVRSGDTELISNYLDSGWPRITFDEYLYANGGSKLTYSTFRHIKQSTASTPLVTPSRRVGSTSPRSSALPSRPRGWCLNQARSRLR